MGWPQIVTIALMAMALGIHLAKHGKPRDHYNFGWAAASIGIYGGLLYAGGFFN